MIEFRSVVTGEWNMGELAGKTAVVTGASKGIGAGVAKAFAARARRSS